MKILVQKFGGTSLARQEDRQRVARRVVGAKEAGFNVVVVVSAMGRGGDPYATDTLLDLIRGMGAEADPRELDLIASCGEIISAVIMASTIRSMGHEVCALSGGRAGIITDANFTDARILRVEPDRVLADLKLGKVVVVAGFQGETEQGDVTTLGRGGSDTTAAALGAALGAEAIEIFTDVDGIKTADPRLVPEARTLKVISYDEISQLAHEGAKVIHPRAVDIAMRNNIPLRIRGTFDDSPGTLVTHTFEAKDRWPEFRETRVITGVTYVPDMARVVVEIEDAEDEGRLELEIFRALAEAGISVDVINVSPGVKSFGIAETDADKAREVLEGRGLPIRVSVTLQCAKVSVVGAGMRGLPGVMANVVEALHDTGVKILQTADSHVTISCLIMQDDLRKAVQALHKKFNLDT
mgnify:CR=1 FL=1